MELALSLGDAPKSVSFDDQNISSQHHKKKELGFCMVLGSQIQDVQHKNIIKKHDDEKTICSSSSSDPSPLQLDLLPCSLSLHQSPSPSHRSFPWLSQILKGEPGSQTKLGRGLDVKPLKAIYDPEIGEEPKTVESSPNDSTNSDTSSFHLDFCSIFKSGNTGSNILPSRKREMQYVTGNMDYLAEVSESDPRVYSRRGGYGGTSDEDENGLGRKKLRLTKEQSAFLEDSFKEHNTLNPKQKLVLANQLNLRPRQVEVWFQNRRARTKLKQTEVDCEFLKTCCESLTEENRRLQKELQELRALKTSQPFYMQLPATTLTMCPSCERVVTSTTTPSTNNPPASTATASPRQPADARCP
uniref:homeobox-leucine zipper protein HAT14-like n=1 Tax=Erigeron canadensis TaxID=72917 RepID=UPI001CB9851F|nr:homeobox-leucine zipper protein HAT14-like [Erigeron canadensis]